MKLKPYTQKSVIDCIVADTAYRLANPSLHRHTTFIGTRNLSVLQKMATAGILIPVKYSSDSFTVSPLHLARWEQRIRESAAIELNEAIRCKVQSLADDLRQHHLENYLRIRLPKANRHYWSNSPTFTFIDWQFTDDQGVYHSINCRYQHECAVNIEARIQALEIALARTEIARLPIIEICAM